MSSEANLVKNIANPPRYSEVTLQKSGGATYTPSDFADFVATKIVREAVWPKQGKVRVLDPAVGDGALLEALLKKLPEAIYKRVEVFGYDTDEFALAIASARLKKKFPDLALYLEQKDFLDHVLSLKNDGDLFLLKKQLKTCSI